MSSSILILELFNDPVNMEGGFPLFKRMKNVLVFNHLSHNENLLINIMSKNPTQSIKMHPLISAMGKYVFFTREFKTEN